MCAPGNHIKIRTAVFTDWEIFNNYKKYLMKKKLTLLISLLLIFHLNSFSQEKFSERRQQEYENFKREREQAFNEFKQKREEELKKMEQAYQDYYNQLHGLKDYYIEKNDTTSANIVDEIIDFENTINEKTDKNIEVTETVLVETENNQDSSPPVEPITPEPDRKTQGETTGAGVSQPDETTFVPLPEEGNTVPVLTPLPKSKTRVTSPFGMRNHPTLKRRKMHNGIDFGSGMNAPVFAAADGMVTLAQYSRSFGNWVMVEHANGYVSVYAHLNSFNISAGLRIKKGEILGYTGNTGRSSGPHLHYEIRLNGTPVNPSGYLTEVTE
jgi:murein DD-endopeptidase MepM/ murein hydrolase activator NlpD